MPILPVEEYVEQSYLFRALAERMQRNEPIQSLLKNLRAEVLATTNLPKAIAFISDELNHAGAISTAMRRLSHYFAPFQAYLIEEAENERGRFDSMAAFTILQHEADCRANQLLPAGMFFFQFEVLCRNRLNYDRGLAAMSLDPIYDPTWARWILDVRHKLGIVDLVDLVYVHSQYYLQTLQAAAGGEAADIEPTEIPAAILFGEKEGRIALANRKAEPLYFFAALQRQLKYPAVPRPAPRDDARETLLKMQRVLERLEVRVKLLEDEQREQGIDLSKFYHRPGSNPPAPPDDL